MVLPKKSKNIAANINVSLTHTVYCIKKKKKIYIVKFICIIENEQPKT